VAGPIAVYLWISYAAVVTSVNPDFTGAQSATRSRLRRLSSHRPDDLACPSRLPLWGGLRPALTGAHLIVLLASSHRSVALDSVT